MTEHPGHFPTSKRSAPGMNQKDVRAAVWGKPGYVDTDSALTSQYFPVHDYMLM